MCNFYANEPKDPNSQLLHLCMIEVIGEEVVGYMGIGQSCISANSVTVLLYLWDSIVSNCTIFTPYRQSGPVPSHYLTLK